MGWHPTVSPPIIVVRPTSWLLERFSPPLHAVSCSGGQRKRVNVGLELVAEPSLLFLGGLPAL